MDHLLEEIALRLLALAPRAATATTVASAPTPLAAATGAGSALFSRIRHDSS